MDEIILKIQKQYDELHHSIPYTMVQATMRNKKEYKVVLFGREPKYVAYNPDKNFGTSFSKHPHTEIMEFAARALAEFTQLCPFAMTDSMMRVDVFQTKSGNFVVNELESLEADHYSSYSNLKKDAIDNQIRMYYEAVLKDLIDEKFIKCKHRIKK